MSQLPKTIKSLVVLFIAFVTGALTSCAGPQRVESKSQKMSRLCDEGVAFGCVEMARGFSKGAPWLSDEQSHEKAYAFYRRACLLESDFGCQEAARTLFRFSHPDPDAEHEMLCQSTPRWACRYAGLAYHRGAFVQKDESRRDRYFRTGCEGDDPICCYELGKRPEGTDKATSDDALALFQKSCALKFRRGCDWADAILAKRGDADAMRRLTSRCFEEEKRSACAAFADHGDPKWRVRSCELGTVSDCRKYGIDRRNEGSIYDYVRFESMACEHGDQNACHDLGLLENALEREDRAIERLTAACERGHGKACAVVADLYEARGWDPKPWLRKAYDEASKCEAGRGNCTWDAIAIARGAIEGKTIEDALTILRDEGAYGNWARARLYEEGWGVPQSKEKAAQIYREACEQKEMEGWACGAYVRLTCKLGPCEDPSLFKYMENSRRSHTLGVLQCRNGRTATGFQKGCMKGEPGLLRRHLCRRKSRKVRTPKGAATRLFFAATHRPV